MEEPEVEVSIVIPCLNEENSIGIVVEKAWQAIQKMGVSGEVIVADNGSTDRSVEIARSLGARVVEVLEKGYGNALRGGIEAARGRYIVIGDADNSYDFLETPQMLVPLRDGVDVVIGSRFLGTILPGAMRWSSRIGNPLVTGILNLLLGSRFSDSQSGMRAFTREAWRRLRLQSTGMEFASEMLIQAWRAGLRIAEVPITFHPDQRGRPPHLRPIRDGWRHLKLMLTYSPSVLFLAPGGLMMLLGLSLMGLQLLAPMDQPLWLGPVRLDFHWAILGSLLTLSGYTLIQAHFLAKIYSVTHRFQEQDRILEVGFRFLTAERVLLLSLMVILIGLGMDGWVLYDWITRGYGALVSGHTRLVIFGSTLAALGVQAFFHTFLFSMLGDAYKRRPPI
ncbi:MAG: glycosyltransferase family 2 protein [Anaerolineae bacterium]|nr:glycosyltransferase family 2 protein [Anaerolineae bacterium]MCX8068095.1 glycosyltransferase family 2 protein [Anaerolineae bacterium]MDW7992268.1 glycosyltransferase family 2 protein [Anaerolineae bacterium]